MRPTVYLETSIIGASASHRSGLRRKRLRTTCPVHTRGTHRRSVQGLMRKSAHYPGTIRLSQKYAGLAKFSSRKPTTT